MVNINKIFIYPTDTIYGIGCDATNEILVNRIREIKQRDSKPFSVIAPSAKWILENFEVDLELIEKYLPGPYTLLLMKKDLNFLKSVSDNEFVGVRIPDCDFTKRLQNSGKPIVTTSVNLSGKPFATEICEVDKNILGNVDEVFDVGKLTGKPSVLIKDGKKIERAK
jgi:L-threonylcarbamoyladenylate synthase